MEQLIIETQNLNFSYSKTKTDIEALNLKVPESSIYGFLGPNGSGKTTTIRLILGLLKKQAGDIQLFGEEFSENRLKSLSKIGALIENPSLYGHLTAKENLKIIANYRGNVSKERIDEVLDIVNLSYAQNKKVKAFSLGMKQRLGIAITLLDQPDLLILDEPTNGLDPKGIIEMRELIKGLNEKYGTTIFISSHLLSEIERTCSHVGIIRHGKILFQDTVKALKASQNEKLEIELETNNSDLSKQVAKEMHLESFSIDEDIVNILVGSKKTIPRLIDELRKQGIGIYQVRIKDNLEELFLSITEN